MRHSKIIDVLGTVLLVIGFILAFLPHAVHISIGLDEKAPHVKHVIVGMIIVIIALAILVYNNKAFKLRK